MSQKRILNNVIWLAIGFLMYVAFMLFFDRFMESNIPTLIRTITGGIEGTVFLFFIPAFIAGLVTGYFVDSGRSILIWVIGLILGSIFASMYLTDLLVGGTDDALFSIPANILTLTIGAMVGYHHHSYKKRNKNQEPPVIIEV